MPLQATSGAASYDAFGGGAAAVPQYIEDVFSTWLYTGDGSARTITNGIDLSTKGGLVWIKSRGYTRNHVLADTVSGRTTLASNLTTIPSYGGTGTVTSYSTTGFTLGTSDVVAAGTDFVSWTFRKQPKFFDVVTYTGDGNNPKVLSHSLGSAPGCMIVKTTSSADNWYVYHTSLGATKYINLDLTSAAATNAGPWNNTAPTSTQFTIGSWLNQVGVTYVVYLFAHNAGGFGLTGTDNVISCGRLTNGGAATTVNLGYEVQWLLTKEVSSSGFNWNINDIMRGDSVTGAQYLNPNTSGAETTDNTYFAYPTATGFGVTANFSSDIIYIAIRRGPMKVPTVGTTVFTSVINTGTSSGQTNTSNFPVDLSIEEGRVTNYGAIWFDRLRGFPYLQSSSTTNEINVYPTNYIGFDSNTSIFNKDYGAISGSSYVNWMLRRAPSFFDEVCYSGTAVAGQTFNHNLTVVPEMMIVKMRSTDPSFGSFGWVVYHSAVGATKQLTLNSSVAAQTSPGAWNNTAPTASVFSLGTDFSVNDTNGGPQTYVWYGFATCAGVSKVGSYTGNGTTQTIDCGFTGGARFVLIKRTDASGDWYTYDTARGMTTLTDPYLLLNSTAAEVATLGSVTTVSTGFALNAAILAAINTNGASYIFLAIA